MSKRRHPLKRWMDETKTRARTVARALRVSEAHVSNVIHRKRHMSMPLAMKVSAFTGIPVENLLNNPEDAEILKSFGERPTSEAGSANG